MAKTTKDSLTGLEFTEKEVYNFEIKEAGNPAVTEIGDGVSYTTNLYDSNNVFAGTKDITFEFIKQLGNGEFIAQIEEITRLSGGVIYTQGSINASDLEQLKREKIDITGGSGIYDGVKGKEYVTQLFEGNLTEYTISFKIN